MKNLRTLLIKTGPPDPAIFLMSFIIIYESLLIVMNHNMIVRISNLASPGASVNKKRIWYRPGKTPGIFAAMKHWARESHYLVVM